MSRQRRYPKEMREKAVQLVLSESGRYPSQWAAICSVSAKLGPKAETIRKWVRQAETDRGLRGGTSTDDQQRIKDLEREVRELKRANEILKSASAFFARELDPRPLK